jgi:pimeloyl-ACP methyl ester carboxylesterase
MILHSNIIGEGYPLIILHGFLGMGDNWKTLGKQFSELGYEVHLVDQRNHGRSFHDQGFSYPLMAEDLRRYAEHHRLEKMILLGHSMGGKTAMAFATEFPDKVEKLMVADISPRYYPVHHETILNGLASLDFNNISSRSEADKLLSSFVPDMGTRQFLLKNLYWLDKGRLGLRVNLPVLTEEVAEVGEGLPAMAKYEGPTLFLRGDRSEYIQASDEALIRLHFPMAQLVTIKKAGHWLHAENPVDFYKAVAEFI